MSAATSTGVPTGMEPRRPNVERLRSDLAAYMADNPEKPEDF